MISTYKGSILKKAAGESRLIPKPVKEEANGGINIKDVRAVKIGVGKVLV